MITFGKETPREMLIIKMRAYVDDHVPTGAITTVTDMAYICLSWFDWLSTDPDNSNRVGFLSNQAYRQFVSDCECAVEAYKKGRLKE